MVKTISGVTNFAVSNTLKINRLNANNSLGAAGQTLYSNGTAAYWATPADNNTTYDLLAIANTTTNQGIVRLKDSANANDDVQFTGANGVVVSSNATHVLITGQINTDTDTLYDLLAIANTAANEGRFRLKSSGNANDDVLVTGTGGAVVSSNATHLIINAPTDTNTTYDLLHIANTVANEGRIRLKDVNNSNDDIVFVGGNGLVFSSNVTAVVPAVLANTGIVANSTGTFVNAAYIATIAANSATGSLTNTFTVGTASYFVSNGNLGIGNTAPAHRLRVTGDISLSGGVHANGSLGSAGQVLTSNGSVAYWSAPSTASSFSVKTANYTAVNGDRLLCDTTAGTFIVTLPATPDLGTSVTIYDRANFTTNPLTVARNGSTIEGIADDFSIDIAQTRNEFVYDGVTWHVYSSIGPRGLAGTTSTASSIAYSVALG